MLKKNCMRNMETFLSKNRIFGKFSTLKKVDKFYRVSVNELVMKYINKTLQIFRKPSISNVTFKSNAHFASCCGQGMQLVVLAYTPIPFTKPPAGEGLIHSSRCSQSVRTECRVWTLTRQSCAVHRITWQNAKVAPRSSSIRRRRRSRRRRWWWWG